MQWPCPVADMVGQSLRGPTCHMYQWRAHDIDRRPCMNRSHGDAPRCPNAFACVHVVELVHLFVHCLLVHVYMHMHEWCMIRDSNQQVCARRTNHWFVNCGCNLHLDHHNIMCADIFKWCSKEKKNMHGFASEMTIRVDRHTCCVKGGMGAGFWCRSWLTIASVVARGCSIDPYMFL